MDNNILPYFRYEDWDIGDDDKLRVGDKINCNHQRLYDGAEHNFQGRIVRHPSNKMPCILFEENYVSIEGAWLDGFTFSRLKG